MLHVKNLTVSYKAVETVKAALENISFDVEDGEFILLCGPSGCGKTTLALSLTGLIPQARSVDMNGSVSIEGLDTKTAPILQLSGRIGIVFQNPETQLFQTRVEEEVSFAPHNLGLDANEVFERTSAALAGTGILHLRNRLLRTLSSGEKQRVAIASVLSMRPKILVLDEPTANLDWLGVEEVMQTLKCLNRELKITVIIVEHRLSAVFGLATRMLVMKEGHITADVHDQNITAEKKRFAQLGLRFPWHHVQRGLERYIPEGIEPPVLGVEPLVTLTNVTAAYRHTAVIEDINLSIHPGEFIALVGKNGTGKSTLARVIAGLHRQWHGRITWKKSLKRLPAGRRVGLIFQNPSAQLLLDTVEEELTFAPENFGMNAPARIQTILQALDLAGLRHRLPVTLSLGEIQRTVLGASLTADPALIILDEPTIGQDWAHLSSFMIFLQRLSQSGRAVLVITHDDKLVCRFAKRVVYIEGGHIAADGMPPRGRWSARTLEEAV